MSYLVLTCRVGETLVIGENVQVTVLDIKGHHVRLGVTAPRDVEVDRQEIRERKRVNTIASTEVIFIDGVGAGRRSIKSCRDGVQWIMVGDRVYWPLSDSDAKRLQSACCGDGSFNGPTMPAVERNMGGCAGSEAQPTRAPQWLREAIERSAE